MNILFVTNKNVDPIIGGIERITFVLAKAFKEFHGIHSFSAFTQRVIDAQPVFDKEFLLNADNIASDIDAIVADNKIDFVIAQGSDAAVNSIIAQIRQGLRRHTDCKLLFVFHNMPGFEYIKMSMEVLLWRILHRQNTVYNLKYLLFQLLGPFADMLLKKQRRRKYQPAYLAADKMVMLSKPFIPMYARLAGVPCDDKFCAIGNAVSFDIKYDMGQYDAMKKKEVLWVGRFDDKHKRLSLTLKVWHRIEQTGRFDDWTLRIVGYGPDEGYYRRLCARYGLRHVSFEGKRESQPYYQQASIFMMTSAVEGFGLVLTEAQQYGVVPMAFDSFAALHDIITDGYNGCIIPEKDCSTYRDRLMSLMENKDLRKTMAANALSSVEAFSPENITSQWMELFDSMKKE